MINVLNLKLMINQFFSINDSEQNNKN